MAFWAYLLVVLFFAKLIPLSINFDLLLVTQCLPIFLMLSNSFIIIIQMSSFQLRPTTQTPEQLTQHGNQYYLINPEDLQVFPGQQINYVSNYKLASLPVDKMVEVSGTDDMITQQVQSNHKHYFQNDIGMCLSLFMKYMGKGKKTIHKGKRLFKFSLKKGLQSSSQILDILPFLLKDVKKKNIAAEFKRSQNNSIDKSASKLVKRSFSKSPKPFTTFC